MSLASDIKTVDSYKPGSPKVIAPKTMGTLVFSVPMFEKSLWGFMIVAAELETRYLRLVVLKSSKLISKGGPLEILIRGT